MSLRGALWDPLLRPVAVLGQQEGAEGCVALIVSKKEAEEMTAGEREEQTYKEASWEAFTGSERAKTQKNLALR